MPIQEMLRIRSYGSEDAKLSLLLATHCAPLLRGLAIANVLTLNRNDIKTIASLLQGTQIRLKILSWQGQRAVLYLYREVELKEYMKQKRVKGFLEKQGYLGDELSSLLGELSQRVHMHGGGQTDYPHEIGIFLGYPVEDVEGFIENGGRNFLYMGYWKVYHDEDVCRGLFAAFDEEREHVVREIVAGKTLLEIAC